METEIESRSWKQELKTGVGNRNNEQRLRTGEVENGWEQVLGTEVGNIHREKEEVDKEQGTGIKNRGWEQGLKEDYKDWKKN